MQRVESLAELARLGVAEVDAVADLQLGGRRPEQRRLHLAGSLLGVELEARRQPRSGQPGGVAAARGEVAAAERGRDPRRGLADDRQREPRRRGQREAAVVVEEGGGVEARPGGDLGDGVLGRGQLEAPGAAPVDDPELGELGDRGDDRSPPLGELGGRAPLHEPDRPAAQAPARRLVADAGDLALVGHQRGEVELRAPVDLLRQGDGLLDGVDRGALRPRLDPAAEGPPARIDVDADPDRSRPGAENRLDRVEVLDAVDHHDRRLAGVGGRAQRQLAEGAGVGGRVGEQQVLVAVLGEPERLRQGVGHQPGEALVGGEDPLEDGAAAHRLARDPDRLRPCPPQHLLRVRPHRIEVDERERRLHLGENLLVHARGTGWVPSSRVRANPPARTRAKEAAVSCSRPERWPSG